MKTSIEPAKEIYYPDRGGYTGFSICVWDVGGRVSNELIAANFFSGFCPGRFYPNKTFSPETFLLESRFFVFGTLPFLVVEIGNKSTISDVSDELFNIWKPVMDEIEEKEKSMFLEEVRKGIHVDELLTRDIVIKINNIPYLNKRGSD